MASLIESFRSEKKMQKKLKESFEEFINKDHRLGWLSFSSKLLLELELNLFLLLLIYLLFERCASHLASYIDDLLKSGIHGSSEEEVEAKLEKVAPLKSLFPLSFFFVIIAFVCMVICTFTIIL